MRFIRDVRNFKVKRLGHGWAAERPLTCKEKQPRTQRPIPSDSSSLGATGKRSEVLLSRKLGLKNNLSSFNRGRGTVMRVEDQAVDEDLVESTNKEYEESERTIGRGQNPRLESELVAMAEDGLLGHEAILSLQPIDANELSRWQAIIKPPEASHWPEGALLLELVLTKDYPRDAPRVFLYATQIAHPTVSPATGEVQIDWNPSMTMPALLTAVRKQLSDGQVQGVDQDSRDHGSELMQTNIAQARLDQMIDYYEAKDELQGQRENRLVKLASSAEPGKGYLERLVDSIE